MKSQANIKQLLQNAQIEIDQTSKSEGLNKLTARLENKSLPVRPKLHLVKFAAAAIVIIAAIIYFKGSEKLPVFSSAAFAQVIEATARANCVYVTITKADGGLTKQIWRDFDRGIMCESQPNGTIRYVDAAKGDQYIYHEPTGKIFHSRSVNSEEFMESMPRPDRMLVEILKEIEGSNAEVAVKREVFNGTDVHVYSVQFNDTDYDGKFEFTVEIATSLLLGVSVSQHLYDVDLHGEMYLVFSYPESIAEDIYAFGVPQNAEIVDVGSDVGLAEVLNAYKAAIENIPLEYVLEEKAQTVFPDGKIRNRTNKYEKSEDVLRNLYRLGWPQDLCVENPFVTDVSIIEDDYSREKDLICVQVISQGHRRRSFPSRLPAKKLFYLNPRRDYICEKSVLWALREPTWPGGAAWPEDNSEDQCHLEYEVTRYAQTETGKWYPAEKTGQTTVWLPDGGAELYKHRFSITLLPL